VKVFSDRLFTVRVSWSRLRTAFCLALGLCFTAGAFVHTALGQIPKPSATSKPSDAPQAPETPQDPLGRTTPRGTVWGFLAAANSQKYDTAAQYLDTRSHRKEAAELARQLSFVLDRRLPAKLNNLSDQPFGSLSEPVDSHRELIGSVVTQSGVVDICLERVERPNGPPIWLFSRQTLVDIPDVYDEIHATSVEDLLPDFLLRKYFGVSLSGWSFFLIVLPLLYVVLSLVNRLASAAAGFVLRRWAHRQIARNPTILPHPLRLLALSGTIFATLSEISLSLLARQVGSTIGVLILIVAFVWTIFLINEKCELYLKKKMESQGRLSSTAVLRPARRMMDLFAVIAGLMILLNKLGINPSATLAGLGVGGIAIALAAQKTLENMIGGASLILDGAIRVGDFFKMGNVTGTIEVIGLRSTRVRTQDRTIVTIPNGQMATMSLENFSVRDQFWLRQVIAVEHNTPGSALNALLADIRALLEHDERTIPATTRVRLLRFGESSLELEVIAYVCARDWDHFLAIQEELLMKIRQAIEAAGVAIGYPARAIYVKDGNEMTVLPGDPAPQAAFVHKELIHEVQSK